MLMLPKKSGSALYDMYRLKIIILRIYPFFLVIKHSLKILEAGPKQSEGFLAHDSDIAGCILGAFF
ncbi:hypothetical protein AU255_03650 [Methyloprofundus sedimenti]|uniref:Uncharacterized protein n=1 Tax=Methyloprofundus sedimenti TaxID=1420851 RepID=A0A1V8M688_9GAMM|nr:hypothetical protein AU255_03650 [Methyloprofundus sedimenti]